MTQIAVGARVAAIVLGSIACGCGGEASAPEDTADGAAGATSNTRGGNPTRTNPQAARDEAVRLRQAVEDLQRRVSALEGRGTAPPASPDASGAAAGADAPPAAGADAAEQADLRDRLLASVATPAEARRYWDLLRRGMPAAGDASGASSGYDGPGDFTRRLTPTQQADVPRLTTEDLWLSLDATDVRWNAASLITDGARGNAARFDADQAHIDVGPCPFTSTQPFTLHAYVRTRDSSFCTVLIARNGEDVGPMLTIGRTPGCVSFETWSWRDVRLTSRHRIDDGAWHEIEVAYDPATEGAILSVDNVRQDAAVLGPGAALEAMLRLGDNIGGASQQFRGDLDEVGVHRRTAHPEAFGRRDAGGR